MILHVPVWVIGTIVYVAAMLYAAVHAVREGQKGDFGFGILIGFFTLPMITVCYLVFWIVLLALR